MSEIELIEQQRRLLRAFRQTTAQRVGAGAAIEAQLLAERTAAENALSKAQQEAARQRSEAETDAHTRRKIEQAATDAELSQVQLINDKHLTSIKAAYARAEAALITVNLHGLLADVQVPEPKISTEANTAWELDNITRLAAEAASQIEDNVHGIEIWRSTARQRLIGRVALAILVAVIVSLAAYLGYWALHSQMLASRARMQTEAAAPLVAAARATAVASLPNSLRPLKDHYGIELLWVPPGEFIMGSLDGEGYDDEHPQHVVNLDGFWIGLTEVTNAQYLLFVEANGYNEPSLWSEEGWSWRQENQVTQPGCWNDEKFNQPDQPVVCVDWYDALAYANWLSRETGLNVRLPTEAEWEKAARGTDGRVFPWGNDAPDGSRLNFADRSFLRANLKSGLDIYYLSAAFLPGLLINDGYEYPAPVGSYPAGASPYGALDMAGNVWEYTSTMGKDYPYKDYPFTGHDFWEPLDDRDTECCWNGRGLVWRGGSWGNDRNTVRAPYRGFNEDPTARSYTTVGIRLVVTSP